MKYQIKPHKSENLARAHIDTLARTRHIVYSINFDSEWPFHMIIINHLCSPIQNGHSLSSMCERRVYSFKNNLLLLCVFWVNIHSIHFIHIRECVRGACVSIWIETTTYFQDILTIYKSLGDTRTMLRGILYIRIYTTYLYICILCFYNPCNMLLYYLTVCGEKH